VDARTNLGAEEHTFPAVQRWNIGHVYSRPYCWPAAPETQSCLLKCGEGNDDVQN
jgi:hypothetical protein